MTYDMHLGLLATQALTDLVLAGAENDEVRYRGSLLKVAEFCRAVRETVPTGGLSANAPKDAAAFISAAMKVSDLRSSDFQKNRAERAQRIESLIETILRENRRPNADEQVQIAETLYSASAADFK